MKHLKIILLAVVVLAALHCAEAQNRYAFELTAFERDTTQRTGDLMFRVVSQNFFKNNEYFGDFIEGYTLPGYTLLPTLVYLADDKVSLEAGAFMLQYGGTDHYDVVVPYLSALWQVSERFSIRMGSIDGALHHGLHDAMYSDERQLTSLPETGVQIRTRAKRVDTEVWLNWHQFIKRGDTKPEKLTGGVSVDYRMLPLAAWQPRAELRFVISHIGGQISDYEEKMQTHSNYSLSLKLARKFSGRLVEECGVGGGGMLFKTLTGFGVYPMNHGRAVNIGAWIDGKHFDAQAEYFKGYDFFAIHGNPLYSSIADREPALYKSHRSLVTAEANFKYAVSRNVRFSLGGKFYYDTEAKHSDYLYGFYLILTPQMRLWHFE